jgi:hypothetical protein
MRLTPAAEVSLLTVVPGSELYSAFGHSAIWVRDPAAGIDTVYNFGTFEFNPPLFYFNFIQGRLIYRIDTETFRQFQYVHQRYYNRSYTAQFLNLTPAQKQRLYTLLEVNNLPENRYYRYDFFYDNCATRIRDVLARALGDSLVWDGPQTGTGSTFRQTLDEYLSGSPWPEFGIDLALGSVIDREATRWERMYLPDYLAQEFDSANVLTSSGLAPLVSRKLPLYQGLPEEASGLPSWLTPAVPGLLLLLLSGVLAFRSRGRTPARRAGRADMALWLISGLCGLILLLLWTATDHRQTAGNLHLLWLLPTHLIAWALLLRKTPAPWLRWYFQASAVLALLALPLIWLGVSPGMSLSLIPFVLLLAFRSQIQSLRLR